MKRTLTTLILLILLINCYKDVANKNSVTSSTLSNSAAHYRYTSSQSVDYTAFNPCTQEFVHITGNWKYEVTWTVVNNIFNYTYHFHYDNIRGVGLTSGLKYVGHGHITDHEQSIWNGESYELKNSSTSNKINFTSRGGDNFKSTAMYHFVVGSDGALMVDHSKYRFNYCQ